MNETITVYINQKPLILTNNEELYYAPPAEHYQRYIYCKYKSDEDISKLIAICELDQQLQVAMLFAADMKQLWKQFESHFELVTAAGGIVLNEKKEVLLIYRNEKWDLPKGKADAGETPEQTGIREVSEETGLQQLTIAKALPTSYHTYKEDKLNYLKTTYWYEMNGSSAEKLVPQAAEKITDIKWVAAADLTKYLSATYTSIASLIQLYTG